LSVTGQLYFSYDKVGSSHVF